MIKRKITSLNAPDLLQKGVISCVLSQDWTVNRIAPDFFNMAQFKNLISNKSKLLHLGIGNGECYRFFDKESPCIQSSISDKLYIDPYDVIVLYLKKCNVSEEYISELSEVMRNEYLVAVSYKQFYQDNVSFFSKKDRYIFETLNNSFLQKNNYSFSYNVLLLLIHVLNTNPYLLLPNTSLQRIVTPMGKHIIYKETKISYEKYKGMFSAIVSIDDIVKISINRFGDIKNIYLEDFRNATLEIDDMYDYILATRSDAFLKKEYFSFILKILKNLKEDGFYISDGILSSYTYEIFYNELDKMINIIGKDRAFIIKSTAKSKSFPLQDISGIIVAGEKANIKNIYPIISKNRLISVNEMYNDESFLRQCIWSDLVAWSSLRNIDLECYSFEKIESIINKYIYYKSKYRCTIFFDNEELF